MYLQVNYLSNTHMALSSIEGRGVNDNAANIQGAKAIKTALQKTSIVIGDDEKYF